MTTQERRLNTLILVAIGKAYNDYSTHLTKELTMNTKFEFNVSVSAINTFVKGIETKLTGDEVTFLEDMTDCITNGLEDMKKLLIVK